MSNGTPEPFEDKFRKRMSAREIVSIVYLLLCVAGGTASLFVDVPFVSRESLPLLALAGVLFLVAMAVLVREWRGRKS